MNALILPILIAILGMGITDSSSTLALSEDQLSVRAVAPTKYSIYRLDLHAGAEQEVVLSEFRIKELDTVLVQEHNVSIVGGELSNSGTLTLLNEASDLFLKGVFENGWFISGKVYYYDQDGLLETWLEYENGTYKYEKFR